jgi:spore coat polysaccharide biosynthesis predicted glycosyltransferase SpsG
MNVTTRVVFRVDESVQVGFGHMSRCRALALALLAAGAQVSFCCREVRPVTRESLALQGMGLIVVPNDDAFLALDWTRHIVVVDGYHFDPAFWQRLLNTRVLSTVCIDDFREVPYVADLVLCYNEGVSAARFNLAPGVRLLLGGRYMLLRPDIRRAAQALPSSLPRRFVVLAAGGTRQEEWILSMLRHLVSIDPQAPIVVLSGQPLPVRRILSAASTRRGLVRFRTAQSAIQMVRLYRRARYLVTPASTLMLEAFVAGCPIITGWVADNQRNSLDFYIRQGLIVSAGDLRKASCDSLVRARDRALRRAAALINRQRTYLRDADLGVESVVREILSLSRASLGYGKGLQPEAAKARPV